MRREIIKHFIDTIWHKLWVIRAGLAIGGIGWRRLILHDLSKFSKIEREGYAAKWHKPLPNGQDMPREDATAWQAALAHHYRSNDHHPQFWGAAPEMDDVQVTKAKAVDMPEAAIREMVADWLAATACRSGGFPAGFDDWPWWQNAAPKTPMSGNIMARATMIASEFFIGRERRAARVRRACGLLAAAIAGGMIVGAGFHFRAYSEAVDVPVWAYVYQWGVIVMALSVALSLNFPAKDDQ